SSRFSRTRGSEVKQPQKTLLLWVVVIVSLLAVWQLLGPQNSQEQLMTYSEFIELVQAPEGERRVSEVKIRERNYEFKITDKNGQPESGVGVAIGPPDADPEVLLKSGVKVKYEKDDG